MPELKLAKLPDRTPIKITIPVSPDLNRALQAYAELYGETESVAELIPYMLASFLESDRGFVRAWRDCGKGAVQPRRQRHRQSQAQA